MNPNLPPLINAMLKESFYPHKCQRINLMQTQMSYIFLTGDYVYKVKKPVNLGFLDYTTLSKRKFFCQQELELNRRLAPEVYLDSLPIYKTKTGYSLEGRGEIAEYTVQMLQLPQEKMFDRLLKERKVSLEQVEKLASKIASFHSQAATNAEINIFGGIENIQFNLEENFSQTEKYIGKIITEKQFSEIKEYSLAFLKNRRDLFNRRIQDGHIRDCHGDLHSAHICFKNGIHIFDCIEFNDRFRYGDTASEVAFLSMDIEFYGYYDVSKKFIDSYISHSGDDSLSLLLNYYRCYRAYVRGKVECFKSDDVKVPEEERRTAIERASRYFCLSHQYANNIPHLIIMCGMVGTGKSTITEKLQKKTDWVLLSSDISRKRLSNISVTEHHYDEYDKGLYSQETTRDTYKFLFEQARALLSDKKSVIIDASFKKQEDRLQAVNLTSELGARFFLIECILDEKLVKQRLAVRKYQITASDGRWEIYEKQKEEFEKVNITDSQHIILDTSLPVEVLLRKIATKTGLE